MRLASTLQYLLYAIALYGGIVQTGVAPRYDPGVMENTARTRGLPLVSCMVSSPTYPIGTKVVIYGYNTDRAALCRVTDESADIDTTGRNSGESDRKRHIRLKRFAELGYREAIVICGRQHINDPPSGCPISVFYFGG